MERKLTFEEAQKLIEKELEKNLEELKSAYLECEKDSEKLIILFLYLSLINVGIIPSMVDNPEIVVINNGIMVYFI